MKIEFRFLPTIKKENFAEFALGDVNRSGIVTTSDLDLLNLYLNSGNQEMLSSQQFKLADVNQDGHATVEDSALLSEIIYPDGLGDLKLLELLETANTTAYIERPWTPDFDEDWGQSGIQIGLANQTSTDFVYYKFAHIQAHQELVLFPQPQWEDPETSSQAYVDVFNQFLDSALTSSGYEGLFKCPIFDNWDNTNPTAFGYSNIDIGSIIKVGNEYMYVYNKLELNENHSVWIFSDMKYQKPSACIYKVLRNIAVVDIDGNLIPKRDSIDDLNHFEGETVEIYSSTYTNIDDIPDGGNNNKYKPQSEL